MTVFQRSQPVAAAAAPQELATEVSRMPLYDQTIPDVTLGLSGKALDAKDPTVLAISPDGGYIATAGADGSIAVRQASKPDEAAAIQLHSAVAGGVSDLAFCNPGGSGELLLLSTGADGMTYALAVNGDYGAMGPIDMGPKPPRPLDLTFAASSTSCEPSKPPQAPREAIETAKPSKPPPPALSFSRLARASAAAPRRFRLARAT